MVTVAAFLAIYFVGGLTLPPLAALAVLFYVYVTSSSPATNRAAGFEPVTPTKSRPQHVKSSSADQSRLREQVEVPPATVHVAAGYFAVCREYVPAGINGKPPERTTPTGEVVGAGSPSVYQSMYRSIFERHKGRGSAVEASKNSGRPLRQPRNVFFVVLRHGHLMLYDDSEQLEVRHVIALAHYNVDIYGGGEVISEGELWVRRNCIRLTRKRSDALVPDTQPYFLFSDNCSDKEDFYFALLQNQEPEASDAAGSPIPSGFDPSHIIKLIQQLHVSKENYETRWINALIGRLFLALYRTSQVEDFIHTKITKKVARVSKPAFLTSVKIQKIDMGDCAPVVTNPKLRELTIDGDLTVEIDVSYKGNFRLEIAAVARIDLGTHFKAREVCLVLSGILKKLEGHLLLRIKPPPSNRVWFSFETMPDMELSIEPVVSSRQITYGVILRAIEGRIREVVGETLVMPNWDDAPFLETTSQQVRGGIWKNATLQEACMSSAMGAAEQASTDATVNPNGSEVPVLASQVKSQSASGIRENNLEGTLKRRVTKSTVSLNETGEEAASSSTDVRSQRKKPKAIRSASFTGGTSPVVHVDAATADAVKDNTPRRQQDAASAMRVISLRSPPMSPVGSSHNLSGQTELGSQKSSTSEMTESGLYDSSVDDSSIGQVSELSRLKRHSAASSIASSETVSLAESQPLAELSSEEVGIDAASANSSGEKRASLGRPLAVAKSWLQSRQPRAPSSALSFQPADLSESITLPGNALSHLPQHSVATNEPGLERGQGNGSATPKNFSQPIGRGQPLPPPGTPLPSPPRSGRGGWNISPLANIGMGIVKRRPVPPPPLPKRVQPAQQQSSELKGPRQSGLNACADPSIVRVSTPSPRWIPSLRDKGSEATDEVLQIPAPEFQALERESPPSQSNAHGGAEVLTNDNLSLEAGTLNGGVVEATNAVAHGRHEDTSTPNSDHDKATENPTAANDGK